MRIWGESQGFFSVFEKMFAFSSAFPGKSPGEGQTLPRAAFLRDRNRNQKMKGTQRRTSMSSSVSMRMVWESTREKPGK